MATATFKPTSQNSDDVSKLTVGEELIASTIAQAQAALWRAELSRCLLKLVVAAMAVTLVWVAIDQWVWSPGWPVRLAVLLAAVGTAAWWIAMRVTPLMRSRIRADYAAQSLELDMPELRHQLSSYVSLRGDLATQGVRGAVVRSIGARAAGQIKQHRIDIPSEAAGTFTWWIVMAVMLAVVAAYALLSPKNTLQSAQRLLMPLAAIDAPSRVSISDVLPGDTEVLADRPVAISAAIRGLTGKDEPVVAYGVGFAQQTPLAYDASTDRYVANVSVPSSTAYQLIAGDAVAGPFQIKTRDVPVASVRQVEIAPPAYTGLPKRTSTGGAISGEENSRATILAVINRAITRARIEFNPREGADGGDAAVRIGPSAGGMDMKVAEDGLSATVEITLRLAREKSAAVTLQSYRVRVWDADGNENPDPISFPVRIIRDLPPEVTIVQPRELTKELPINAQQLVEITAIDPDYGLRRVELVWQRGADQPKTEILWSAEKGERGNQVAEYRFRPEKLGLRVGDRVKVAAAALDNREDEAGKYDPNRTVTQPVEWTIVEPRQLPPPTAPEDGVSESDGEPANAGEEGSQSGKQGGEKSGGGQSGEGQSGEGQSGASDGGEGESEGQKGKSGGQGGESGDEKGEKSDGKSGGKSGDGQADSDAKGESDANGESSSEGGSKEGMSKDGGADGKSGGEPGEAAGEDSAGNENPTQENRSDSTGKGQPNRDQSGDQKPGQQKSGDQAAGDSMPQADGQQNAEQNGQQNGQPQPQDGKPGSDQGGQPGMDQPSPGQPGADQSPGEGSDGSQPPEHDGDAFEKIRDYLNKKRDEASQKPDPSSANSDQPKQPQSSQPGDAKPGENQDRGGEKIEPSGQPQGGADPGKTDSAKPDQKGNAGDANQSKDPADASSSNKPESGEPGADSAGADKPEAGKPGEGSTGESKAGKDSAGEGNPGGNKPGEGKPGEGKPGSDPAAGDQNPASGEPAGDQKPSDQKPADQKPGDQPGGNQQPGDAKPNGGDMPGDAGADGKRDPSRPNDDKRSDSPSAQSSGGGVGDGNTSGSGGADGDGALPPEPVDVEYARKATDLVLDYLDQNRDTPDPELLERLNWTPEELQDFTQRWKQLLKSQEAGAPGNAGDAKQVEETLRSLGIRPPNTGPIGESRDRADTIRNLRDSGNRPAAPSIYRDAFEAFRRGVNR